MDAARNGARNAKDAVNYAFQHLARQWKSDTRNEISSKKEEGLKCLTESYDGFLDRGLDVIDSPLVDFKNILDFPKKIVKNFKKAFSVQEQFLNCGFQLELNNKFISKFTNTEVFKFQITYKGIPIYGSSVIVDIDKNKAKVYSTSVDSIASIEIEPPSRETLKQIESSDLKNWIKKSEGYSLEGIALNPKLYYYYDEQDNKHKKKWRLIYITQIPEDKSVPEPVDYIVDITEKKVIDKLPWIRTLC